MVTDELLDYVRLKKNQRLDESEIKNILLQSGWQESDIKEAFVRAAKLPPTGQLLRRAWVTFKQNYKKYVLISAIPQLSVIVIILPLVLFVYFIRIFSTPSSNFNFISPLIILFLLVLFVVIYITLSIWGNIALVYAIARREERVGVKDTYKKTIGKIIPLMWISFLETIIEIPAYMFFVIPGIIISVWFSFTKYVLVVEGIGGMDALVKSREYVRNRWWAVLWIFIFAGLVSLVVGIFYYLLAFLLGLPLSIIVNKIMNYQNGFFDLMLKITGISGRVLSWLVSFVVSPVIEIYLFLVYEDIYNIKGKMSYKTGFKDKIVYFLPTILPILFVFLIVIISLVTSLNRLFF